MRATLPLLLLFGCGPLLRAAQPPQPAELQLSLKVAPDAEWAMGKAQLRLPEGAETFVLQLGEVEDLEVERADGQVTAAVGEGLVTLHLDPPADETTLSLAWRVDVARFEVYRAGGGWMMVAPEEPVWPLPEAECETSIRLELPAGAKALVDGGLAEPAWTEAPQTLIFGALEAHQSGSAAILSLPGRAALAEWSAARLAALSKALPDEPSLTLVARPGAEPARGVLVPESQVLGDPRHLSAERRALLTRALARAAARLLDLEPIEVWSAMRTVDAAAARPESAESRARAVRSAFEGAPAVEGLAETLAETHLHLAAACEGAPTLKISASSATPLPLCMNLPGQRLCKVLKSKETILPLEACPTWVWPEPVGAWSWSSPPTMLEALIAQAAVPEAVKAELPARLTEMLRRERLGAADYVRLLKALSPHAPVAVAQHLAGLAPALEEGRAALALAELTESLLGAQALALGLEARAGEPAQQAALRHQLLPVYAWLTRDTTLAAAARELTDTFINDPRALSAAQAAAILPVAAWDGDEALWQQLVDLLPDAPTEGSRRAILAALAAFEEPNLRLKTLTLVIAGEVEPEDFAQLARGSTARATRTASWTWAWANEGALTALVGEQLPDQLPWLAAGFCSREELQGARDRVSAEHAVLGRIEDCLATRARLAGALGAVTAPR